MTHPQVKALETRYAGCRFRSRPSCRQGEIDAAYAAARSARFGR